jgi:molecular chaperone DnaK (HSP70)
MNYDVSNHPVIGIDLGTTFSSIARWNGEEAEIYTPKGEQTMQSVVYFDDRTQKFIFGTAAFKNGVINPDNMCLGVKRFMDDKNIEIKLGDRELSPVDISAMILKNIYFSVEEMFPKGVYKAYGAVVTVPYYFKVHQCENTVEAAKKAGLNLLGIIQEPIAAALAYGIHELSANIQKEETMMVFDLGGGTFDLTIFKFKESKEEINFEVMVTGGDDRLGGLDFDNAFMEYIIEKEGIDFKSESNTRIVKLGKQKLLEQVIKSKEILSSTESVYIGVSDVIPGVHIDNEYTREDFEEAIEGYIDKIKDIMKTTIQKAGLSADKINRVLKVGGSSKIPAMDSAIREVIGEDKVYSNINPSLCVAQGAAIYGAYLAKKLDLGKEIKITTATAHALGVEDSDGKFITIIHENQKTPANRTLTFTTDEDNCSELDIEVYQGNSRIAKQNSHVGTVSIKNLIPAPKETLKIKITFEVGQSQEIIVTIEQKESNIKKSEVLKLA